MFQIDPLADPNAPTLLHPIPREILCKGSLNLFVQPVGTAAVPQPVGNQHLTLGCLAEFKAPAQIFLEGNSQIVGFKSVQRDVDFVQSGCRKQQILLLFKQGAVGGQDDLKTRLMRKLQKCAQLWVNQGFTHEMKVEKIRKGAQLGQQGCEFFLCHGPFFPFRTGTEGTG